MSALVADGGRGYNIEKPFRCWHAISIFSMTHRLVPASFFSDPRNWVVEIQYPISQRPRFLLVSVFLFFEIGTCI